MNRPLSSSPDRGNPQPSSGQPTLGTLAAALVTCRHPTASRIASDAARPSGAGPVLWCGACGARHPGHPLDASWQVPSLTARLTKTHFEQLVLLLHAVRQLYLLAQSHASPAPPGSPPHMPFRSLRATLSELARLPLVRDIDLLEEAITQLPRAVAP